jgi:phosphate transport system substrate-binding protein
MRSKLLFGWLAAIGVIAASGCGSGASPSAPSSGAATALIGAGSTFVNPAMSKWTYSYQQAHPGITINYQSVGSGAGISQLKAGTVDFAASDVAMSDKDMAEMQPVTQVPVISGCVTIAYNLPGIDKGLKLSPEVIADIYLGKITTWNDARIASQNPAAKLPATPITVAHRSDGSGTTYIFTDYLSAVSPAWKAGPG